MCGGRSGLRSSSRFRLFANEARGRVRVARARVARPLRIGASGTLHDDRFRRVVTLVFGGDEFLWRGSGLDPLGERREYIMIRIHHRRRPPLSTAEPIRSFAAATAAMLDARQKKKAGGLLERVRTGMSFGERLVEGDRRKWIDDRIRPALVDEQFAAMRLERVDIGDRRAVYIGSEHGVCFLHVVIE